VITWAAAPTISYGTALSSTQLNATSGGVAGAFVYVPSAGTLLTAGTNPLSVTFTPSNITNYFVVSATNSITVTQSASSILMASSLSPVCLRFSGYLYGVSAISGHWHSDIQGWFDPIRFRDYHRRISSIEQPGSGGGQPQHHRILAWRQQLYIQCISTTWANGIAGGCHYHSHQLAQPVLLRRFG